MKPRVLLIKAAPKADRPSLAPPLGIMLLAAALRDQADVRLYDAGFDMYGAAPPPVDKVRAMIAELRPIMVGISALTCERECMIALAAAVKAVSPETVVVVGGPYPTAEPEAWRESPDIDWALCGEGDEGLPKLLRAIVAGELPRDIPGLVDRVGTGPHLKAPAHPDLDALPIPAYDLIDIHRYADTRFRNQTGLPAYTTYTSIMTSRGCPYKCGYCHDVLGKKFRGMSVERVMQEVDAVVALGVREVHFVDDIFNFDLPRAKAIFRAIAERHPKLRLAFPNGLRADRLDQEFATLAKAAGCWYAGIAVETASARLQKAIQKHLNLDKVSRAIGWLEDAGVRTRSFIMLGFPTETEDEMEASIRYIIGTRTSEASFFNVVPYAGSELYLLAEDVKPGAASESTQAPFYSDESFYSRATGVSLEKIRDRAILRFYLSRGRFFKVLWRTPLKFWFSAGFLETLGFFGVRAAKGLMPWRGRGRSRRSGGAAAMREAS
ncbi:MAG: B12-binding domain-containing radical SAM protein [Planctomycetes bacterium]|nr:B12-binding domain-containing radical SAM protein [Planctomycetota bacterium]